MNRLTLSRAARAAGVSRGELQAKIEAGELRSFEGMVLLDELVRVFPAARMDDSPEIQRMEQIKEAALSKPLPAESDSLGAAVERLRAELAVARAEATAYRSIIDTLTEKLVEIQDGCDERQRTLLQAVLSWLIGQLNQSQAKGER